MQTRNRDAQRETYVCTPAGKNQANKIQLRVVMRMQVVHSVTNAEYLHFMHINEDLLVPQSSALIGRNNYDPSRPDNSGRISFKS